MVPNHHLNPVRSERQNAYKVQLPDLEQLQAFKVQLLVVEILPPPSSVREAFQ